MANPCSWLFLLGPAPFAVLLCFSAWMAKRISGWGICVSPFVVFSFVVVCAVDLPFYMTTGVNVDMILNCFFTCKDPASERDRPYQRKKKLMAWRACVWFGRALVARDSGGRRGTISHPPSFRVAGVAHKFVTHTT